MIDPVIVRPATIADLESVGRITLEAYLAAGQLEEGPDGAYGQVLKDAHARYRDAIVFVAAIADAIVGTVTITPEGSPFREVGRDGEVEFRFLAVDPSAWGMGVATALIGACVDHATQIDAERMVICVRDTNEVAMAMYVKRGFARLPERDFQPVPGVDLLALHKDL